MENIRNITILEILLTVTFMTVSPALAYGNDGAHQAINLQAVEMVNGWMQKDSDLKYAQLSDELIQGVNVYDNSEEKTPSGWIEYGGYSADEGGLQMALKHFYNPITKRGISDRAIDALSATYGITGLKSVPATDWAMSGENPYSYDNARAYFWEALGTNNYKAYQYGKAWRAVGESMHLVSDMTVPAHVRNDAHPPKFWPDPYESATTSEEVKKFGYGGISKSINYNQFNNDVNIGYLMEEIAKWTNANFYSEHTIPERSEYVQNRDSLYFYGQVDGLDNVLMYRGDLVEIIRITESGDSVVKIKGTVSDKKVLETQQRLLIPNAVYGSANVLWVLLPRFKVFVDGTQKVPDSNEYIISGHLEFIQTNYWRNRPKVANGAFLKINQQSPIEVTVFNNEYAKNKAVFDRDLYNIKYKINANEGDTIRLYYDFGGYKIISDPFVIQQTETQPNVTFNEEQCKTYSSGWRDRVLAGQQRRHPECDKYHCYDGICYPVATGTI